MSEVFSNVASEKDLGYGNLFSILIRRRFWLVGVFSLASAISIFIALSKVPNYSSSMQLLVESNYKGKQGSTDQFADSNVEIDYATQLKLMQSSKLVQRAVDLLKPEYPDISATEVKSSLILKQVADESGKSLTNIVQVTYTDIDPIKAQRVLKAFQNVYQNYNREQQEIRLSGGLNFINEQIPQVQERVYRAEKKLEIFRKTKNFISPESQSQALVQALSSIETEQRANRTQLQELQGRYLALQNQLPLSLKDALVTSRLSQSSRYQILLNEIQKTDLDLAQQRLRFSGDGPPVQRLTEKRQSLFDLAKKEVGRILASSAAQRNTSGESLLKEGQLGSMDQDLTNKLVDAKVNMLALQARAQSLEKTKQQLSDEFKKLPALLAEYNNLLPEVNTNRNTLDQLLKAKQELSLEIARGGFDWQVVEEPQVGSKIDKLRSDLLVGFVVSLTLGMGAAFIIEAMDNVIHTTDELREQAALPLLGSMPSFPRSEASQAIAYLPAPKEQASPSMGDEDENEFDWQSETLSTRASKVLANLPLQKLQTLSPSMTQVIHWPPFRESLDVFVNSIQLLHSDLSLKSLVITSAMAGEGKSTVALGLAMSAARLHKRVLLIDADLRRPSLHEELRLSNEEGLSTLLENASALQYQSPIHEFRNISILTSGPLPKDPATLLSSPQMGALINFYEQHYDLLVLDVPPVIGIVDALLTASFCSGVVMVGRIDQTNRTEFREAANLLSKLNVIGVVANGVEFSKRRYPAYGYP
jgi:capsular exopolysaccharide synthesis family protein